MEEATQRFVSLCSVCLFTVHLISVVPPRSYRSDLTEKQKTSLPVYVPWFCVYFKFCFCCVAAKLVNFDLSMYGCRLPLAHLFVLNRMTRKISCGGGLHIYNTGGQLAVMLRINFLYHVYHVRKGSNMSAARERSVK